MQSQKKEDLAKRHWSKSANLPACSACSACSCGVRGLHGRSNRGRSRGPPRVGAAPRGQPANRSAPCRRPITDRLSLQICPAVRGGAAESPSAAGYTCERLQEATGQGEFVQRSREGESGRPSHCASPVTYIEA